MKKFQKEYWIYIVLIILLPYLFKLPAIYQFMDFSDSDKSATAINGFTAPIINFISIILLYRAFTMQKEANDHLKTTNETQVEANKYLKTQNEFKFLMDEFSRIENKILELKTNNYISLGNSVQSSELYINSISEITYVTSIYNSLIININVNSIDEYKEKHRFIHSNDRIILTNVYYLYTIVFEKTLERFDRAILKSVKFGETVLKKDRVYQTYKVEKEDLGRSIGKIRDILFTA